MNWNVKVAINQPKLTEPWIQGVGYLKRTAVGEHLHRTNCRCQIDDGKLQNIQDQVVRHKIILELGRNRHCISLFAATDTYIRVCMYLERTFLDHYSVSIIHVISSLFPCYFYQTTTRLSHRKLLGKGKRYIMSVYYYCYHSAVKIGWGKTSKHYIIIIKHIIFIMKSTLDIRVFNYVFSLI